MRNTASEHYLLRSPKLHAILSNISAFFNPTILTLQLWFYRDSIVYIFFTHQFFLHLRNSPETTFLFPTSFRNYFREDLFIGGKHTQLLYVWKCLFCPHFWKIVLLGIKFQVDSFFHLGILQIFFYSPMAFTVVVEKSLGNLITVPS